jgi:cell wall-associated NlpC family hydrolase
MKPAHTVRQLLGALLAASAVLALCSARAPLSVQHDYRAAHGESPHLRAVRRYEVRQAALRDSVVRFALAQLGTPYVLGGTSPKKGFDCSGLVRYVYSHVAVTPPRTAKQQARVGAPISRDRLRPGDLITFGQRDVTHIGIYIGEGKFVHASSAAGRVIVSPLDRRPTREIKPLNGARRLLATADVGHTGG